MIKKIKRYLKSKNPYLVASAIIVVLSVGMIFVILHKGNSSEDEAVWVTDTVIMEELWELPEELSDTSDEAWEEQLAEVKIESATVENESTTAEVELTTDEIDPEAEQEIEAELEKERETVSEEEAVALGKESESASLLEDTEDTPNTTDRRLEQESGEEEADDILGQESSSVQETSQVSETTPDLEPAECTHSWMFESYYQEPDCSNGGLENQICLHCGASQTTIGTPTGKHVYATETPGDCCSEEVVACTVCNHREVREKDPWNHMDVEEGFCYGCGQEAK